MLLDPAVYRRAAELIAGGFATGVFARDAQGKEVAPLSVSATRFCLVGALLRAGHDVEGWSESDATRKVRRSMPMSVSFVMEWSDQQLDDPSQVLRLLQVWAAQAAPRP